MPQTLSKRNILVTSALPYANGPIHIGHLVEYIQTDIWVRFQKMRGHRCFYVCADDAHGTPIMLKAKELGITTEQLIADMWKDHRHDFDGFRINFDNYYSTHSEENREIVELIFGRLVNGGHIYTKIVSQMFDPQHKMFLPDRYVKGRCPRCGAEDQYGDNCDVCGATYSPTDLIDPYSAISGAVPVMRDSEHYFFRLPDFESVLKDWIGSGAVSDAVAKKLDEWLNIGLRDWNVSRDEPYFGFEIPGLKEGGKPKKFFYVWLDAPIGYMASFKNFCSKSGHDFDEFWGKESQAELYHFVGKDITYFHALFWPAVLSGAGFRLPSEVFVHGFLTVDGKKMSKSKGTFVRAATFLEHLDPDFLRYYFAAKIGGGVDDLDLSWDDFVLRINSDVVGKIVNVASRCTSFVSKQFDGRLSGSLAKPELFNEFVDRSDLVAELYESRNFSGVVKEIVALAGLANQFIDDEKPWVLAKDENTLGRCHNVCTTGINLFRLLVGFLGPVVPDIAGAAQKFLGEPPVSWNDLAQPLLDCPINKYSPLAVRVSRDQVDAVLEASKVT